MDRLSVYIARQLAGPYVLVLLALVGIILVSPSLRLIDLVLSKGLSGLTFAELLLLYAPRYLAFTLPFLVFVATVIAYARLNSDSELVALQSAGRSNLQLARAALAFAAVVALLGLLLEAYAAPAGYHRYRAKIEEVRNSYASFLFRDATFLTPARGLTVFVRERDEDGNLKGILLHDGRDPRTSVSVLAERGTIRFVDGTPRFQMFEGSRQEMGRDSGRMRILTFRSYELDLGAVEPRGGKRVPTAAELGLAELLDPPGPVAGALRRNYAAEAHRRLQAPLLILLMALVGTTPFLLGHAGLAHPLRPVLTAGALAIGLEAMFAVTPWLCAAAPAMIWVSYAVILAVGATLLLLLAGRVTVQGRALRLVPAGGGT